jgi:aspartyl-tRNA(Asn)/glutamyl-tRNA(Gln) amidotransferase subunit A
MADFDFFTISELTNAYRSRHLSPVEVIESAYARATRLQPELNIFAFLGARESLLEQARLSEARWRSGSSLGELDGVPMTVKDTILVAGWPTLRGSMTVDPQQGWGEDSPAVARLREQGVIFLGKTNTPEFGWTGVTQSPLCGVSRNPWNRSLTPGGSSGGSAAAVAVGIGHASLGTDAGGSLRIPASFCGVVAFKPTAGLVAYYPPSPAGTLGHVGPITRSVSDAATMLNIIGVPDVRDWPAMPRKGIDYRSETESGLKGCRIAWSPRLGFEWLSGP